MFTSFLEKLYAKNTLSAFFEVIVGRVQERWFGRKQTEATHTHEMILGV